MEMVTFLAGCLAVWRITHLLVAEEGPYEVFTKLRSLAADGFWGRLLSCFYCTSVWVATAVSVLIGGKLTHILLSVAAYSGAAILLERATAPAVPWVEEKTDDITNNGPGMLRSGAGDPSETDSNKTGEHPSDFTANDNNSTHIGTGISPGGRQST